MCMVFSQNLETECIKTTWPLKDGYQIDTYNSNGQRIQMIRIETSTGDTTQWHITEYNGQGQKASYYSVIETNYAPFMIQYQYDEQGELISKIKQTHSSTDTIFIEPYEPSGLSTNSQGDPLYDEMLGNLGYEYDENGNQTLRYVYNDEGDTLSERHMAYNSSGHIESITLLNNDTLTTRIEFTYNEDELLEKKEEFNHNDEIVSITHYEYDTTQFETRAHGVSYGVKWEMLYERIDCEKIIRNKKLRTTTPKKTWGTNR